MRTESVILSPEELQGNVKMYILQDEHNTESCASLWQIADNHENLPHVHFVPQSIVIYRKKEALIHAALTRKGVKIFEGSYEPRIKYSGPRKRFKQNIYHGFLQTEITLLA